MSRLDSLDEARRLLADEGVDARVEVVGHAADVLVVHAAPDTVARLRLLSDRLHALGFRYVTIDLAPVDA